MAVQVRNSEMIDLLSADFSRNKIPQTIYGSEAGFAIVECVDLGSTSQELIPNDDSFDVKRVLWFTALVASSAGGEFGEDYKSSILRPGQAIDIFYDGQNACQLRVDDNGSVIAYRSAGTATFNVILQMMWI